MTLSPGIRVGPYEIQSPLGAGGMGEVYRARDANLNRDVALKVLPESLAHDPESMARFQREAKALAALNHPNIAAIYGLEEFRSTRALAMELVEGQTLADRLSPQGSSPGRQAALSIEEALPIAKQIAEALEYAHERGIIHRDLKPANIKIATDGTVKVLDFGLAKTLETSLGHAPETAVTVADNSPTLEPVTETGIIVGTAAYMSPEQARGKTVDRRTDIWSFGCVLFEMISGRRPFEGETITDILAAVVRAQPDWHALPPATPAPIRDLLRRCLTKDSRQRLRDIGDARIAIEETTSHDSSPPHPVEAVARQRTFAQVLPWAAAALLLVTTVVLATMYRRAANSAGTPIVSQILPAKGAFESGVASIAPPELSPDGRRLVYVAPGPQGKPLVWVRRLDSTEEALPLTGTEDAKMPFWSPDGRRIGFFNSQKLMTIEASGGPPAEVCNIVTAGGGAWTPDNVILFPISYTSPIYRVSADGGKPVQVTSLNASRQETGHSSPQLLPDNRHFLYHVISSSPEFTGTYVGSLDGGESKLILRGNKRAVFAAPDYLLFGQNGALMARPFDPARLEISGDPVPITSRHESDGILSVTTAPDGALAYLSGQTTWSQMQWFDREGNPGEIIADKQIFYTPKFSPGGTEVAVGIPSSPTTRDIWIFDLVHGKSPRPITFDKLHNFSPVWSPDGRRLVYSANPKGQFGIYERSADGTGTGQAVIEDDADEYVDSWSKQNYLAYERLNQKETPAWDIWVLPLFGDRKARPFLAGTPSFNKEQPSFSPDGKFMAYAADERGTGDWEVYIVPFPSRDGKWQVSAGGGEQPRWRGDGKELFYLAAGKLMAADVRENGASIEIPARHMLFPANAVVSGFRNYDVTADGKRFLMVMPSQSNTATLTLIINWPELLQKSRSN